MWENNTDNGYMEEMDHFMKSELSDCIEMLPYIFAASKFDKKDIKKMKKDIKEMERKFSNGGIYDICE